MLYFLPSVASHDQDPKDESNNPYSLSTPTLKSKSSQASISARRGLISAATNLVRRPAESLFQLVENVVNPPPPLTPAEEIAQQDHEARRAVLYLALRSATTIDEWRNAATELDNIEGSNKWKAERESDEYDWELVQSRLNSLEDARISRDPQRMLILIRTALSRHLGGMGNIKLYEHSHIGTKVLIDRYIETALETLATLLQETRKPECGLDPRTVMEQVLAARQSFGRSALLLSGGGTFGMNHVGVVKCLWDAKLLPRIISGSSAGSIVCSVLCTRTDDELPQMMEDFCYGDLDVFVKNGTDDGYLRRVARLLKHGALFDVENLVRVMRNLLGDMTFQEGYNRTRRILNICVSSASIYELPRLLNYLTAPNVIIWSAVQASCSVPGVFTPLSLLAKDPRTGESSPWNPTAQAFIDGSVDGDLPMTRLAEMFNVNHFIVSQVNPHVIPFLGQRENTMASDEIRSELSVSLGHVGPAWMQSLAGLARDEALHRMQMLSEAGVLPNIFTKLRSVFNQRFSGDITIYPEVPYTWFPKVLENPTTPFMLQACYFGERATWPQLSRIQNHCAIELALDDAIQQLRARIAFSPSQVNLRLGAMGSPNNIQEQISSKPQRKRHVRHQTSTGYDLNRRLFGGDPDDTLQSSAIAARSSIELGDAFQPRPAANEAKTVRKLSNGAATSGPMRSQSMSEAHFEQQQAPFTFSASPVSRRKNSVPTVYTGYYDDPHDTSFSDDGEDEDEEYFTMAPRVKRKSLRVVPAQQTAGGSGRRPKSSAGSTPYPRSPARGTVAPERPKQWQAQRSQSFSPASLNGTGLLLRSGSFYESRPGSRGNPSATSLVLENDHSVVNDVVLARKRSLA